MTITKIVMIVSAALGTLTPATAHVDVVASIPIGYVATQANGAHTAHGEAGARTVAEAGLHPSSVPPRPHYVAGYTPHALERMALRRISKAEVEALVASPNPGRYQDDNDTWLITDGRLIVIINRNAWIVTGIKGQM